MLRLILPAIVLLTPTTAEAFHFMSQFADHPFQRTVGAGGRYYTGSPRSDGMDCTSCHIGAQSFPNRISLAVTTQVVNGGSLAAYDLFSAGYQTNTTYKITVAMTGEHRGICTTNRSYQGPAGAEAWKFSCPDTQCTGPGLPANRDHFTAEVMSDAQVYATSSGNAAGRLQPDSAGTPAQPGQCRQGPSFCNGGQFADFPTPANEGGPTTTMFMNWRMVDPNDTAAGPLGRWECLTNCDAIVSNNGVYGWTESQGTTNPFLKTFSFFWTAPNQAPPQADGRIRFYLAAVDSDGYFDTMDDDVATVRVAVCPAGAATCNPIVGPGWGLGN